MTQLGCAQTKVALITGAAKRLGAEIAKTLHCSGDNVVLHYNQSNDQAQSLCDDLNQIRADSAITIQADLFNTSALSALISESVQHWQRLDILINNASAFYPTPMGEVAEDDWDNLLGINLKAPFFLAQSATEWLQKQQGCIVNIDDIHALRPLKEHSVYSISKSGLRALTLSLAKELGPQIRVNGVSPGAILWPEQEITEHKKQQILARITLARTGHPSDIAKAVHFLVHDADYITGQILAVDGGRTLFS